MKWIKKETSRLFVTEDSRNKGVYFAKTNTSFFARFYQRPESWEVWIYPWKLRRRAKTFTQVLAIIDTYFKKHWEEVGEIHNR